jgi:hypothetical protein
MDIKIELRKHEGLRTRISRSGDREIFLAIRASGEKLLCSTKYFEQQGEMV